MVEMGFKFQNLFSVDEDLAWEFTPCQDRIGINFRYVLKKINFSSKI